MRASEPPRRRRVGPGAALSFVAGAVVVAGLVVTMMRGRPARRGQVPEPPAPTARFDAAPLVKADEGSWKVRGWLYNTGDVAIEAPRIDVLGPRGEVQASFTGPMDLGPGERAPIATERVLETPSSGFSVHAERRRGAPLLGGLQAEAVEIEGRRVRVELASTAPRTARFLTVVAAAIDGEGTPFAVESRPIEGTLEPGSRRRVTIELGAEVPEGGHIELWLSGR